MTDYTYTVREPGMPAWQSDLATTDDAQTSLEEARAEGLKRATIYAVPDNGGALVEMVVAPGGDLVPAVSWDDHCSDAWTE